MSSFHSPNADGLMFVAEALQRRHYGAALQIIYKQLTGLTVVSPARSQWTALEVYCHMKLKHYAAAASQLDLLPPLPTKRTHPMGDDCASSEPTSLASTHGLRCSYYDFLLQLMASIFPLCTMNIGAQDATAPPIPFPAYTKVHYLDRLYALVYWTRQCKMMSSTLKKKEPNDDNVYKLYRTWEIRHLVAVRCLANCLVQLEMYEAAISFVHQEILQEQPESVAGLLIVGRVYLAQGAIASAEYHFGIAECLCDSSTSRLLTGVTNAMVQLAQNEKESAVKELRDVLELEPKYTDQGSRSTEIPSQLTKAQTQSSVDRDLGWSIAVNNLAVSLLYSGQVKESIALIEHLLLEPDKPNLFFAGLRNLLTLYEFSPQPSRKIMCLKSRVQVLGADEDELLTLFPVV